MTIRDTLFEENKSRTSGGAILVSGGTLLIENSTMTGDRSLDSTGHAISMGSGATVAAIHSTLIGHDWINTSGDAVIFIGADSTLALDHTVIWTDGSNGVSECDTSSSNAFALSNGFNFDSGGACTSQPTDRSGVDPRLWPLGDYGDAVNGRTLRTFLPRPDSPLIDGGQEGPCAGALGAALTVDARGVSRPLDGDNAGGAQCDPGAVEFDANNDPVGRALNVTVVGGAGGTVTSNPAGIDCPGNCGEFFINDSTVELIAQPDPGFVFSGWGADCSGTGSCQVVMDTNRDVATTFVTAQQPLSVSVVGQGSVTSNPTGIDCPGSCSEDFKDGSVVTLSADPDPGFGLASWSGDCSGSGTCQVTMDTARSVRASFIQSGFTLSTEIAGNAAGSIVSSPAGISCPGDCSQTYPENTSVNLTPMPAAGVQFLNWADDCTGSPICTVIMSEELRVIGVFATSDTIFIDSFE